MKYFLVVFVSLFLLSCSNKTKTYNNKTDLALKSNIGKELMQNKCLICHSNTANHSSRIAPPMFAVKNHYLNKNTTKKEFISDIQNWIKNPTQENVKMHGAVKKFGIMPKQVFSEKTIEHIASYMYDNELEKPKGFHKNHNGKGKGKGMKNGIGKGKHQGMVKYGNNMDAKTKSHKKKGVQIALATKTELGKNLMKKIQKEGILEALKFCNINALPITDSMSKVLNANIKRVSDKPRNLKNRATFEEEGYIKIFKQEILEEKEANAIVREENNTVNVYYPIKTNGLCLQCHGNPKTDIKENVLASLKELYPNDKAVGYSINEIRGIWKVSLEK
uniref:Tll0287-like domain-containing protein n=1 Tax=uncultured Polaribacter sp. TaxID=174711 RepID=UPI00262D6B1B|nr:DUF3365 domain-containing protein [uncultured Polaribacter sp.]